MSGVNNRPLLIIVYARVFQKFICLIIYGLLKKSPDDQTFMIWPPAGRSLS